MSDIFISYSRKDKKFVERLTQALKDQGLEVWVDLEDIRPGEDWKDRIFWGIAGADVFVFLISPDSVESEMCQEEIAKAFEYGKRISPIYIRETANETIPPDIRKINWISCKYEKVDGNIVVSDDFESAIDKIIEFVRLDNDWLRFKNDLQLKFLKWEKSKYKKDFLLHGENLVETEKYFDANKNKEPHLTELQKYYIRVSRIEENKRASRSRILRYALGGVTILAIIATSLALLLGGQVGLARLGEAEQANIALAQKLTSQAQSIYKSRSSMQLTAVLLAVQSMKMFPSGEAAQFLLNNNLSAYPIAVMKHNAKAGAVGFSPDGKYIIYTGMKVAEVWDASLIKDVGAMPYNDGSPLFFSPDGKYVVSRKSDNILRIWQASTGNEVAQLQHDPFIGIVEFSPSEKYIATVSIDGSARIWEIMTGKEVSRIKEYGNIESIVISSDDKFMVSASQFHASVWDRATGEEVSFIEHDYRVTSIAISPDSKYIVSGSGDGIVKISEVLSGKQIYRLKISGKVTAITYSPDGKYVLTGGGYEQYEGGSGQVNYGAVQIWDAITGNEVTKITFDGLVSSAAFSPDGEYIVASSYDGTARVWEVFSIVAETDLDNNIRTWKTFSFQEVARMNHPDKVIAVAFSPNGKIVISYSSDGTALAWKTTPSKETIRLKNNGYLSAFSLSSNGNYIASGSGDGITYIWETFTGKELIRINNSDSHITLPAKSVAFSPNEEFVAIGDKYNIRVFGIPTGDEIVHLVNDEVVFTSPVAFSPNGYYLASGGAYHSAIVWEVNSGKELFRVSHNSTVNVVSFSPNGKYIASGDSDGIILVSEVITGKEIAHLEDKDPNTFTPFNVVNTTAFSADGNFLASGHWDGTIRIWETLTGQEITHMKHESAVNSITFSPDGKYLSSGSSDGSARIWETITGKEIARMNHDDTVSSIAFTPNGKYIISGSWDKTARVWDASTGKEVARMNHGDEVWHVIFSPDGNYAISASIDGVVRVWVWQAVDLIKNACAYLPRNLSRAEWNQYIGDLLPYQAVCENLTIDP